MVDDNVRMSRASSLARTWPWRVGRCWASALGLVLAVAPLVSLAAGCNGSDGHGGGGLSTASGGALAGSTGTGGAPGSTGSTGGSPAASPSAASQYVDAINAVRAAVTQPSGYAGTWAALPGVAWSDTVAASAQAWASNLADHQSCALQHESQQTYGENLAMGTSLSPAQAVALWAGEKSLYTWSPTYSLADFNAGSGHYTQLVWRKSSQVGCGSASCGKTVVISCRFSPPGNVIGQAVY